MRVEEGWRFTTADFSLIANGRNEKGVVRFIRSPEQCDVWHSLPDDLKESDDCPELYVVGRGFTLEEAFVNANLAASHAMPLGV